MLALLAPLAASYTMLTIALGGRAPAAALQQPARAAVSISRPAFQNNATIRGHSLFRGVAGSESSVRAFWESTRYLGHDSPALEEALIFASAAHAGQRRKSGEPYIVHPIETATILAELRMDTDTVIAGLLHDTVEDTDVSAPDIRRRFGNGVANIVEGVTDGPKGVPDKTNQCALLLAMSMDWRIVVVKLADRLHNMRTLDAMPRDKQIRKAQETMSIFVPLARELGISHLETELELRCAQTLFPQLFSPLESISRIAVAQPAMRDVTRRVLLLLSNAARFRCPAQLDSFLSRDETLASFDAAQRISSHRQRWAEHLDKHAVLSDAM
jgi:GTP pyrophosphokinase